MPLLTGFFSKSGSPALRVTIKGPFTDGIEYDAIIDTGFTGFLSLPLIEAIRLGLVLYGTTPVSFADGSQAFRLTARGMVKIQEAQKIGVAILEPSSTEVLLGMGFLRVFEKAFFVTINGVILVDEKELEKLAKSIAQASPTEPPKVSETPETSPPPAI